MKGSVGWGTSARKVGTIFKPDFPGENKARKASFLLCLHLFLKQLSESSLIACCTIRALLRRIQINLAVVSSVWRVLLIRLQYTAVSI